MFLIYKNVTYKWDIFHVRESLEKLISKIFFQEITLGDEV